MKAGKSKTSPENDAAGQSVRNREHGRTNSGVVSARPRVVTGTEDATFETQRESGKGEEQDGVSPSRAGLKSA